MHSFFAELQRRHVYKVGAMYAVAGWLLVQVVTQVFPIFDVSALAQRIIVLAIVAGFPVALVLSWIFDITPLGIVRTAGQAASGEQRAAAAPPGRERLLNYLLGGLLLLAAVYLVAERVWLRPGRAPPAGGADKSIAVLPFENLSDDKANAYFASGMQDEILTRLAKIGSLRVISRTSTAHFASSPEDLPDIGRQLGVANILEGSVQKAGDAVHINVQLINTQTDAHLWAEVYDRKLTDVFGVEGEVAKAVADALQAKLGGGEQQAVSATITDNARAYDDYLRGLVEEAQSLTDSADEEGMRSAAAHYADAVRLDPGFALAWAHLSIISSYKYLNVVDRSPALLDQAKDAADTALRLQPEAGEAYLALGYYRYWCLRDFDGGLAAFNEAQRRLPNNADVLSAISLIERRQGRWDDAIRHQQESIALDPRNVRFVLQLGGYYGALQRYPEALRQIDRALDLSPDSVDLKAYRADLYQAQGRLDEADKLLQELAPTPASPNAFLVLMRQMLLRRQFDSVIKALRAEVAQPSPHPGTYQVTIFLYLGLAEHLAGNEAAVRPACGQGLAVLQSLRTSDADDVELADSFSLIYACLGEREAALREARRAVELNARDAYKKPAEERNLVQVQILVGDNDAALAALPHLLQVPNGFTTADLRYDPLWDPLRSDPRFKALLAGGEETAKPPAP